MSELITRGKRKPARDLDKIAETFVKLLHQSENECGELLSEAKTAIPPPGYAIPMIVSIIEKDANEAVNHVFPWGFAEFSILFRMLSKSLADLVTDIPNEEVPIYIALVHDEDPAVERYLRIQHACMLTLNERVSVVGGMLNVSHNGECYQLSIADSRRRSALTLLRTKALHFEHSEEERIIISKASDISAERTDFELLAKITLSLDMREIDVLRKGLPGTWQRMLAALGITDVSLLSFLAFTSFLPIIEHRWLNHDQLFRMLQVFTERFERDPIDQDMFDHLINLFASDLEEAQRLGSVVPFIRVGSWYRSWPFVYHTLLPELVFISLIQGKRGDIWSTTFGSDLARAADYLATQLSQFENVTVVTRRKKASIGDIDMGIYDHESGELLICEIKTVFDRFRTEFQASNFTDDRVNFEKATQQLNVAMDALLSGVWPLRDVVGKAVPARPSKVYRIALLWRDHINPSLDGDNFIPSCDFASFRYLFNRCAGKPRLIAESIEQLEKIFWVSRYAVTSWPVGDEQLIFTRELETDALPPMSFLDKLPLNEVVRDELRTLRHFPENWAEQLKTGGDEQPPQFLSKLI